MSACVSSHGEYSDHATNEDLWCTRCYRYDTAAVDAAVIELNMLRARDTALRALVERWRAKRCEPGCEMCAETDECAAELERALGGAS